MSGAALREAFGDWREPHQDLRSTIFRKSKLTSCPVLKGALEGQTARLISSARGAEPLCKHAGAGGDTRVCRDQCQVTSHDNPCDCGTAHFLLIFVCLSLVGMNPGLSYASSTSSVFKTCSSFHGFLWCPAQMADKPDALWSNTSLGSQRKIPETLLTQTLWVRPCVLGWLYNR